MVAKGNKTRTYTVKVLGATPKAWRVAILGVRPNVWLPKSQVAIPADTNNNTVLEVEIPGWLIKSIRLCVTR